LQCIEFDGKSPIKIECRIIKHEKKKNRIYNYTKIGLKDNVKETSFLMPFIGV